MSYHALMQSRDVVLKIKSPHVPEGSNPEPIADLMHNALKGLVLSSGFPCYAAKSAFNTCSYRLGVYDAFSDSAVAPLADDLRTYIAEYAATPAQAARLKVEHGQWIPLNRTFATFLACFKEEPICDEETFEARLWSILEDLRGLDSGHVPPGYSTDPAARNFAFCFGGEAFFVAALHPGSWRWSRRFMFPLLVFNMHKQFDALRASGTYDPLRDTIRRSDENLQSPNDIVCDFGVRSEAPQYAMRRVPPEWMPPGYSGR